MKIRAQPLSRWDSSVFIYNWDFLFLSFTSSTLFPNFRRGRMFSIRTFFFSFGLSAVSSRNGSPVRTNPRSGVFCQFERTSPHNDLSTDSINVILMFGNMLRLKNLLKLSIYITINITLQINNNEFNLTSTWFAGTCAHKISVRFRIHTYFRWNVVSRLQSKSSTWSIWRDNWQYIYMSLKHSNLIYIEYYMFK